MNIYAYACVHMSTHMYKEEKETHFNLEKINKNESTHVTCPERKCIIRQTDR